MPRRDTNFFYSFAVLPADRRDAIVAVWDFFRAVDDAVDEMGEGGGPGAAEARLAAWRREVAACFEGGSPATPQGAALVAHVRRFGLPRQGFEDVVDGVAMDLAQSRWRTFEELHQYCLRVASAVGLVCIEIFGYRNAGCRQYAIDLGVALQLTNILRDLGKDFRAGRLYLPQTDLDRHGVSEAEIAAGLPTPGLQALLADHARRAHEYFDRAERELPPEDRRSLLAARIMAAIYRTLLRRIEQSGFAVFGEPVRLPRWRKALIALRLWVSP